MRKCIFLFFIWILAVFIASRMINAAEEAMEKDLVDVKMKDKTSLVVDGVQDKNRRP